VTNIKIYLTTLFRAGEPHTTTGYGVQIQRYCSVEEQIQK
jgi:hypothetical protein